MDLDSSANKLCFTKLKKDFISPGKLDEEQFWLLVEISSIHSEKVIKAMRAHLVHGIPRKNVCNEYNVNNGYLSTSLSRLNYIHRVASYLSKFYRNNRRLFKLTFSNVWVVKLYFCRSVILIRNYMSVLSLCCMGINAVFLQ
ncbi:adhesin biosynthesis transcription regulatory family protein [Escherichia coli]|uniref:adhesin biosynthesis transcription regulatory family protein n=1 Tax=Escherichia coli TaxID=562 RepID=UPI00283AACC2|nr:adhesin biosynthesis transcription regulatory family protein [Escherichia coli]